MVITSVQLPAVLPPCRELARLSIFSLAAVMLALLAARFAALAVSLEAELAQEEMAVMASSSNFRHFPKVEVQAFRAAVTAWVSLLTLQFFNSPAVEFSFIAVQQVQASSLLVMPLPMVLPRQSPASVVKFVTSAWKQSGALSLVEILCSDWLVSWFCYAG